MAGLGGLISNLISRGTALLPAIQDSLFTPWSSSSSSSSSDYESKLRAIERDMEKLMRMLKRIQATLRDAEKREITDEAVQLWLTELREVAYEADDVLDEWRYEQIKAQVEARNASNGNPNKRKLTQIPEGLADQIKGIRCKFDEICKDHENLKLREEDGMRITEAPRLPIPTSHIHNESNIFGRENEKDEVINLLQSDCDKNNLTVLPIVGMGGLGKTTLARLVYHDERVCQKFDKLGWVWVFDDFDVKSLTKAILETITGHGSYLTELSMLQGKLETEVAGKSLFMVLDDVWNDQQNYWQSLIAPFFSAKRVSILVTTRNQSVALITQTVPFFKLNVLPDEQCWKLFQHYALRGFPNIEHSNMAELGRIIIDKCSGLPLAVKSIAALLRYENEERWEEILQSEIWKAHPKNEAFAAIRISYMRLSEQLKSCILFCSLFPKGNIYQADELINLWIAHDYVVSRDNMSRKEIGMEYIKELRQRAFLEVHDFTKELRQGAFLGVHDFTRGTHSKYYKIHDIVHDLLRFISNGTYRGIHADSPVINESCHHLLVKGNLDLIFRHRNFLPHQLFMLRTLILRCTEGSSNDSNLSNFQRLRVLEIYFGHENYSPDLLGQMKHLRHLVLQYTYHRDLEPISQLFNLTFLLLADCKQLKKLPEDFGNIINLKYFCLISCGIESLPESFFLLSNLEELKIKSCNLEILQENLGKLVSLRKLEIDDCPLQAFPDSLCELSNLKTLKFGNVDNLKWRGKITKLPEAIGKLSSLQELYIYGNIIHLPPSFNKIYDRCRSTKLHCAVVGENGGIGWLKDFKNFKGTLCFEHLSELSNLDEVKEDIIVAMHNLEELVVGWHINGSSIQPILCERENILYVSAKRSSRMYCEEMPFFILESLQPHPNLKRLALSDYPGNRLPAWMGDPFVCASLHTINLHFCDHLNSLPFGNLRSLRNFGLRGCNGLSSLHEDSLPSQLEKLGINLSDNLISMPVLSKLVSLVELRIFSCTNLRPFMRESDCDANYWLPPASCGVVIEDCPLLKDWCVQQGITYEGEDEDEDEDDDEDEDEDEDEDDDKDEDEEFDGSDGYSSEGDGVSPQST